LLDYMSSKEEWGAHHEAAEGTLAARPTLNQARMNTPDTRAQITCSIAYGYNMTDFAACVAGGGPAGLL
jgi:hypothetical protein